MTPRGLIKITFNAITGQVTEWWYAGPEAGARERDLRACHALGEVVRYTGRPPQAAVWTGPIGEHVAATTAVTLRYRPNGLEPWPGQRPASVVRSKLLLEVA
jgi:hypothetical protein